MSLLSPDHEVVAVGNSSGQFQCDLESKDSLHALFSSIKEIDAVVVAAGSAIFVPLEELQPEEMEATVRSKLMGQINTVLIGREYVNPKGSFTLTSGIIAAQPFRQSSAAAVANCGIEGFVRTAALELPQRINCVSPTLLEESYPKLGHFFPDLTPIPSNKVALAYEESITSSETGQIYQAWH